MSKLLRVPSSINHKDFSPVEPHKIQQGSPQQRLNNVFTNTSENFFCGVWESTEGTWSVDYTEDEFCYLIEGKAILTDSDGVAEEINPGDGFVIPAGYKGTWQTIGHCKKFYSIYEAS